MIPVSAQISSLPGRILPRMTEMLVTCPPTLEFVNPAENSLIAANDSRAFDWTPGIPYDHAMRIAGGAMIGQFACYTQAEGNEVTSAGHGDRFVELGTDFPGDRGRRLPPHSSTKRPIPIWRGTGEPFSPAY